MSPHDLKIALLQIRLEKAVLARACADRRAARSRSLANNQAASGEEAEKRELVADLAALKEKKIRLLLDAAQEVLK